MSKITPLGEIEDAETRERFARQASVVVIVPPELHPDSKQLVAVFAEALADKLRGNEVKYGRGNGWLVDDWRVKCQADMVRHLVKGDPRDAAIYCAFLWAREWPLPALRYDLLLRAYTEALDDADGGDPGGDPTKPELLKPRGNAGVANMEICCAVLSLVGIGREVTEAEVATWSQAERDRAYDWAIRCHLSASDNDDVLVPPCPDFLRAPLPEYGGAPFTKE
jgi:hypothetical protein